MKGNLPEQLALMARLPRTWPAFIARYGSFTPTQLAAIPALLDGQNSLISAATASGKTEAALAPLIERHCPAKRQRNHLAILYLTPTRALASDLHTRLAHACETLDLRLAVKTSDRNSFRAARPPDILITTPESCDSLLASHPRLLANLRAIIIDELHLLDGTPRGDQLQIVLRRIRRIREYAAANGDAPDATLQLVALSATIGAPAATAARYLGSAVVITLPGQRASAAERIALSPISAEQLISYLKRFQSRGWRKALVFCNSRIEVESYAAAVRANSPFGEHVFVHYSNIDARRRREIEQQFSSGTVGICFSTSTLELGIDIGDIDLTILIGPPGSSASFSQRIGRAGRRSDTTRVACFYRTELEQLLFEALLAEEPGRSDAQGISALQQSPHIRPAVAIQQIFSLIKQSPIAAVRLPELASLFSGLLERDDLAAILGELEQREYLQAVRSGEWRAGAALNALIDSQASSRPGPSIHTNIQTSSAHLYDIRDQSTGQTIARVDSLWLQQESATIEGRSVRVEWADGEVILVRSQPGGGEQPAAFLSHSARQPLSYALARLLPAQLGLGTEAAPLIPIMDGDGNGWRWFHWLGDVYGQAALDLLRYRLLVNETNQIGLFLHLAEELRELPSWSDMQIQVYLQDTFRLYEPLLDLGPFQNLLPLRIRQRAVVEQFAIARFQAAIARLQIVQVPEEVAQNLVDLGG
ncbi:MAG: DEAD/DEAH box helicase [Roseiflexaceae bacterium]|nr:DEAD/DEAH box helicase [Roseiflexaceae bacterium]